MDIKALIQAFRNYIAAPKEQTPGAAKAVDERLASALPSSVMPHDALERQRQKIARLDAMERD